MHGNQPPTTLLCRKCNHILLYLTETAKLLYGYIRSSNGIKKEFIRLRNNNARQLKRYETNFEPKAQMFGVNNAHVVIY